MNIEELSDIYELKLRAQALSVMLKHHAIKKIASKNRSLKINDVMQMWFSADTMPIDEILKIASEYNLSEMLEPNEENIETQSQQSDVNLEQDAIIRTLLHHASKEYTEWLENNIKEYTKQADEVETKLYELVQKRNEFKSSGKGKGKHLEQLINNMFNRLNSIKLEIASSKQHLYWEQIKFNELFQARIKELNNNPNSFMEEIDEDEFANWATEHAKRSYKEYQIYSGDNKIPNKGFTTS